MDTIPQPQLQDEEDEELQEALQLRSVNIQMYLSISPKGNNLDSMFFVLVNVPLKWRTTSANSQSMTLPPNIYAQNLVWRTGYKAEENNFH